MKYLLDKLFKGRTVKVGQLAISCENPLRVPLAARINVNVLEVFDSRSLSAASSLIANSCLPLSLIKLPFKSLLKTNNNPITSIVNRKTKKWHFKAPTTAPHNLRRVLTFLQNRRVTTAHFERGHFCFSIVIEYFMGDSDIENGTYYTFDTTRGAVFVVMERSRKRYKAMLEDGSSRRSNQLTIKKNSTSKLVISKIQQGDAWILGFKIERRRLFPTFF
ncbi:F-box domain-containing protein [Caenorhabditis elegans]|nr:F-box domain-containing protein [Caenorhabditis elegans]CUV67065.1 F-box domain-containing protein [Caenorhabditis elegans]|eukprot:NP_001305212.1 F-box C protein [Caenorhabditis elegans]